MIESSVKPSLIYQARQAIDAQVESLSDVEKVTKHNGKCVKAFLAKVKELKLTEEEAEGFLIMVSR